ncbi:hypothetical protein LY76DRAFT_607322 [Colletotrichum caudatum]|nr:hypothetical protein LY76DRAFT_607322 [Colletotrichum caudatum]
MDETGSGVPEARRETVNHESLPRANELHPPQIVLENTSPPMGWSDIDGIIQSFVRGQDSNAVAMDMGQAELHNQPLPTGPGPQPAHFDSSSLMGQQTWFPGVPDGDGGAASFDDLLFGFNGSALDSVFS